MVNIDALLSEWAYRCEKGYPDMDSPSDLRVLKTILKEQGIKLPEQQLSLFSDNEMANMIQKDTGIDVYDIEPDNKAELKALFGKMSPELKKRLAIDTPPELERALNKILNLRTTGIVLKILQSKEYHDKIIAPWSDQLSNLIEDVDDKEREKFLNYLKNEESQATFPTKRFGNFEDILLATNVSNSITNKIIEFTAQDEKKLGVGMGEVALAMFFKDISSPKKKGDLSINGEEFEIKGHPATLGDKPAGFEAKDLEKLQKLGISRVEKTVKTKSGKPKPGTFIEKEDGTLLAPGKFIPELVDNYKKSSNKEEFKNTFKEILIKDAKLGEESVNARFDKIDFEDPESFQREIPLMNFIRYASKEGFTHFLAHDYGASAPSVGEYVYVSGTPEEMANQLRDSLDPNHFQPIGLNNLRPRIRYK